MKRRLQLTVLFLAAAAAMAAFWLFRNNGVVGWQSQARPGRLSAAHAHLESDCAACHTAVKGVEDAACVGCHADNRALLQRQPTAFHADIGNCAKCHAEHQGVNARLRVMDHGQLARIGFARLEKVAPDDEQRRAVVELRRRMRLHEDAASAPGRPNVTPAEMTLDCASCHGTKDRHQGLFGRDCASCHATTQWAIAEFDHPSPRSQDCAQCHQAPPSHYMMHFEMVSKRVAGVRDAQVSQCYLCHQTTSWNDIKGVGWYKHH
jgi:hypothetical protein